MNFIFFQTPHLHSVIASCFAVIVLVLIWQISRRKRFVARILRFGLTKRLRRGGRVTIFPSWRCNYACTYCAQKINGKYPKNDITLPLEAWKDFLITFNKATVDNNGIREVILTGGEPTLLPYFTELASWILFEKKWHLTIFTNLTTLKLLELKPSIRLRVDATFHHHEDPVKFNERYQKINKVHRVDVEEICADPSEQVLSYSRAKPYLTCLLYTSPSPRD